MNVDIYRKWIINSLYEHDLITQELYEKCSKPYITGLPGDLRSTDGTLLAERMDAIEEEIARREDIINRADYRIGVKSRDSERLGKRVEKSMANMDKAIEKIVDESDKIVKNVEKSDFEKKIKDLDSDDKSSLLDGFNDFRKAHNTFFSMDLDGGNVDDYQKALDDYVKVASDFNNLLKENGSFTKADIKNSDIKSNVKRIQSNIDKYVKEGKKISKDVQGINDNQVDIDYISSQRDTVAREIEDLTDEFMNTHNKYMEQSGGPDRRSPPNPRAIVNDGNKPGDSFTFLPNGYEVYMVD